MTHCYADQSTRGGTIRNKYSKTVAVFPFNHTTISPLRLSTLHLIIINYTENKLARLYNKNTPTKIIFKNKHNYELKRTA